MLRLASRGTRTAGVRVTVTARTLGEVTFGGATSGSRRLLGLVHCSLAKPKSLHEAGHI